MSAIACLCIINNVYITLMYPGKCNVVTNILRLEDLATYASFSWIYRSLVMSLDHQQIVTVYL